MTRNTSGAQHPGAGTGTVKAHKQEPVGQDERVWTIHLHADGATMLEGPEIRIKDKPVEVVPVSRLVGERERREGAERERDEARASVKRWEERFDRWQSWRADEMAAALSVGEEGGRENG